jgi:WD40 repeat protein
MRPWMFRLSRWCVVACAACRTIPVTSPSLLAELRQQPAAFLSGAPVALSNPQILNREDFVYDAKLSRDGAAVALSSLGSKDFMLSLHTLGGKDAAKTVPVNPLEFDVESLEFSPDGTAVATVSRDGSIRVFDARSGALQKAWLTDEKLSVVALSPNGQWLAVGSAKGLVTLLSFPALVFQSELRVHGDEVRGLVFADNATLLSGGWDKKIVRLKLEHVSDSDSQARVAFETKNGQQLFRGVVDGAVSVHLAVDARLPVTVLKSAVAAAAGLDVSSTSDTLTIASATGPQLAKRFRNRSIAFKGLQLTGQEIAVCDVCVVPEAQGALGAMALAELDVATDATSQEMVLARKQGAQGAGSSSHQQLRVERTFSFAAAVNDVSVNADGRRLGVAFSETKAERTRAVYEREKRNEVEPAREWDCAAIVDAATGDVLLKKSGHRGVVSTVGISPDGLTLASGGWDKTVRLHGAEPGWQERFGWAVRRVRFSKDGSKLVVAAWTPQNPLGNHQSDPAAVVYDVNYAGATLQRSPQ